MIAVVVVGAVGFAASKVRKERKQERSDSSSHAFSTSLTGSSGAVAHAGTNASTSSGRDCSLKDGMLVCLRDPYGQIMVAQQVGRGWELTATASLPCSAVVEGAWRACVRACSGACTVDG